MYNALITGGLALISQLIVQIPQWIARGRASGELTAEQEAEYQRRQQEIFARPYAQPGTNAEQ